MIRIYVKRDITIGLKTARRTLCGKTYAWVSEADATELFKVDAAVEIEQPKATKLDAAADAEQPKITKPATDKPAASKKSTTRRRTRRTKE